MDEKNLEKLLDDMIEKAGKEAIEEMTKEDLKHLEDAYPYEISEEHERKMKKIFEEASKMPMKKEEGKASKNNIVQMDEGKKRIKSKNSKKVFVLVAAAVMLFAMLLGSVGAFRDSFVKYFLNVKEEYSEIKGTSERASELLIDNIYFGYIPEGYVMQNKKKINEFSLLIFSNDELYLNVEYADAEYAAKTNTENGNPEEIIINNKDMIYSDNGTEKMISWREKGRIFVLHTNDTKEILVKIVENMEIGEENT